MKKLLTILTCVSILLFACNKEDDPVISETPTTPVPSGPNLIFKIHLDSTLARLDNFGNPVNVPVGNASQSPRFNKISAHYIEFAPTANTALGNGYVAYMGAETTTGGSNATDFNKAITISNGDTFYSIPLSTVAAGTYEWLRVSVTYQNYDIDFKASGFMLSGTLASFVGFNTYITNYNINTQNIIVNGNKLQGYWGFETSVLGTSYVYEGQAPATTVPNPIAATSPIPAGSCVVTGSFPTALTLTGNETEDIIVNINLSTNNSFEWKDLNGDGVFEPSDGTNPGDTVVDMGLRGLFPTFQ